MFKEVLATEVEQILHSATCTREGNFLTVPLCLSQRNIRSSVLRCKVAFTSKKKKKTYIISSPIKNKFCIKLVYPCFGHRRAAKLMCKGTSGCADNQHYPSPRLMLLGYFVKHWRKSSYWNLEIPIKTACKKWKYRQIIIAHNPSILRE